MMANNSENIRESALDFTALFGEINPDMPIFANGVCRVSKGLFSPLSLLLGGSNEKIVKSTIFYKNK